MTSFTEKADDSSALLSAAGASGIGVDRSHPDRGLLVTTGALVAFAAVFAFAAWSVALTAVFDAVLPSLAAAALLAGGIFWIDRSVAMPSADGRGLLAKAAARAGVALTAAYLVAQAAMLQLFPHEIAEQRAATVQEQTDELLPAEAFERAVREAGERQAGLDTVAAGAQQQLAGAVAERDAECRGTGGSMRFGFGPLCAEKSERVQAMDAAYRTAAAAAAALRPETDAVVARARAQSAADVAARAEEIRAGDGLLGRRQALEEVLAANPGARRLYWAVEALIVLVDLSPLLMKVLGPRPATAIAGLRVRRDGRARAYELTMPERVEAYAGAERRRIEWETATAAAGPGARLSPGTRAVAVGAALAVVAAAAVAGGVWVPWTGTPAQPVAAAEQAPTGPVTAQVSPGLPIDVDVPGAARLTAPAGSVTGPGTLTAAPASAVGLPSDGSLPPLLRAGDGVDVTFAGTALAGPVDVAYPAGPPPAHAGPGLVPVVAHLSDDGTWNLVPATWADGRMVASTDEFSPTVPAWLTPAGWMDWIADRVAASVVGKTSPWTCEGPPPGWVNADKRSALVHACAMPAPDGSGAAEVRLRGDWGVGAEVTFDGPVQYAWVEDQNDAVRRALSRALGGDPARTVYLPAGAKMSIGYRQPEGNLTAQVLASPTARSGAVHVASATVDAVIGLAASRRTVVAVAAYALEKCAGLIDPSKPSFWTGPGGGGPFALCVLQAAPDVVEALPADLRADGKAGALLKAARAAAKVVSGAQLARPFLQQAGTSLGSVLADRARIDPSLAVTVGLSGRATPAARLPVGVADGTSLGRPADPQSQAGPPLRPAPQAPASGPGPAPAPTAAPQERPSREPSQDPSQAPSQAPSARPSPTPRPLTAEITVDNRVTNGGTQMREDTPAYLSARPENFCNRRACALDGTNMGSGHRITAVCQAQGARTTNGNDSDPADDANPGLIESTRWYVVGWPDGRRGYLSEAWVAAGDRGGKGLPACSA